MLALTAGLVLAQWTLTIATLRFKPPKSATPTAASFPLWPAVAAVLFQTSYKPGTPVWTREWLEVVALVAVSAVCEMRFRSAYQERERSCERAAAPPREAPDVAYSYKLVSRAFLPRLPDDC